MKVFDWKNDCPKYQDDVEEKEKELKERAAGELGDSISSYARKVLFKEDNTSDFVDNTNASTRERWAYE